jgi:hypothetical protein
VYTNSHSGVLCFFSDRIALIEKCPLDSATSEATTDSNSTTNDGETTPTTTTAATSTTIDTTTTESPENAAIDPENSIDTGSDTLFLLAVIGGPLVCCLIVCAIVASYCILRRGDDDDDNNNNNVDTNNNFGNNFGNNEINSYNTQGAGQVNEYQSINDMSGGLAPYNGDGSGDGQYGRVTRTFLVVVV